MADLGKAALAKTNELSARLAETSQGIGVNISEFPRFEGESDDIPRFQRAVNHLKSIGGGRLVVPNTGNPYLAQFISGSTILNPTRVKITSDNIEIVGVGNPLIEMKGLDINYLFSIDDYVSSGRDIFTVFSFCGVKNCKVIGIRFKGEYTGNQKFRYQSPRAIAISFKGCTDCLAEDLHGEDLLGNLVNVVHSYVDYDAPFANCYNIQVNNSHAVHCLENGFNYMGGTYNSKVYGLSATRCANGFESASDGLTVNASIFRGNRSSGIGLSGKNQILNGVIGCESVTLDNQGNPENNSGYGLVITGGEGVQINGGMFNDNRSFGIYIYPGVKRIYGSNIELKRNATNAEHKVVIQMVGTPTKPIEDIQFTDCTIEAQGQVTLTIGNYTKNVRLLYNFGTFEDTASAVSFGVNSVDSRVVGNKFNKPVTMNDPTGEEYNNGLYRNIDRTSIPTTGTWILGDVINNRQRSPGGIAEWNCVQSGTFGVLNNGSTTGTIEQDSKTLVVSSSNGLYKGAYITISGVSGVKRIVSIDGLKITLDNTSNASVSDATVAYRPPVIIPSRQNGVFGSVTSSPSFVGQIAVTVGSTPKSYIAVGTSSVTDWLQITN